MKTNHIWKMCSTWSNELGPLHSTNISNDTGMFDNIESPTYLLKKCAIPTDSWKETICHLKKEWFFNVVDKLQIITNMVDMVTDAFNCMMY